MHTGQPLSSVCEGQFSEGVRRAQVGAGVRHSCAVALALDQRRAPRPGAPGREHLGQWVRVPCLIETEEMRKQAFSLSRAGALAPVVPAEGAE